MPVLDISKFSGENIAEFSRRQDFIKEFGVHTIGSKVSINLLKSLNYLYLLNVPVNLKDVYAVKIRTKEKYITVIVPDLSAQIKKNYQDDINTENYTYFFNRTSPTKTMTKIARKLYPFRKFSYDIMDTISSSMLYMYENWNRYEVIMIFMNPGINLSDDTKTYGGEEALKIVWKLKEKFKLRSNATYFIISELYYLGLKNHYVMTLLLEAILDMILEDLDMIHIGRTLDYVAILNNGILGNEHDYKVNVDSENDFKFGVSRNNEYAQHYNILALHHLFYIIEDINNPSNKRTMYPTWIFKAYNLLQTPSGNTYNLTRKYLIEKDPKAIGFIRQTSSDTLDRIIENTIEEIYRNKQTLVIGDIRTDIFERLKDTTRNRYISENIIYTLMMLFIVHDIKPDVSIGPHAIEGDNSMFSSYPGVFDEISTWKFKMTVSMKSRNIPDKFETIEFYEDEEWEQYGYWYKDTFFSYKIIYNYLEKKIADMF